MDGWTMFNFELSAIDFRAGARAPASPSRYHVTRKSRNGARRSIWHCELFDGLSFLAPLQSYFSLSGRMNSNTPSV